MSVRSAYPGHFIATRSGTRRSSNSAVDETLMFWWVAIATGLDARRPVLDLVEFVFGEDDVGRSDVFDHAGLFRRSRDGNDPRPLREHPGERGLSGRRVLLSCDPREQLDERLVRTEILRLKPRDGAPEIRRIERR